MVNGQWSMVNGQWSVVSGQWSVVNKKSCGGIVAKGICINLPVKDLKRSVDFFTALGYSSIPTMTDEYSTAMMVEENITLLLITEEFFTNFTTKPTSDASKQTEVIISLQLDNREAVDEAVAKAVAAGATLPKEPYIFDFMYGQCFHDLDGHVWEFFAWTKA